MSSGHNRNVWSTSLIAATLLWAAATTAAAQQSGSGSGMGSQQQSMPGQTPGQQMPEPGMSPNGGGAPGADNTTSYADRDFLHKTFENSLAQQQMGQLAAQKSQSDDVKQFGEKIAQIHGQLDEQLQPIAKHLGVDQPKSPSKKDKQEIAKLQGLNGPQFDAAFIQAMAKDQETSLKDFNDEQKDGHDPNVQKAAQLDEPVLTQHLQVLKQIAQAHNVSVETDESSK